jgi:non-heme chloroperoxidase
MTNPSLVTLSVVRATSGVLLNPFHAHSAVPITLSQFHYNFANHLATAAEAKPLWERYAVPAVAHVLWQGALGTSKAGHADFGKRDRAPLLLIAGTIDHTVPESTVRKEYAAYQHAMASSKKTKGDGDAPVVELKVFEGRSHGIVNQDGWEEVVDFSLAFAEKYAK